MKYGKKRICFLLMALCLCACGNKDIKNNNEYRLENFSFLVPDRLSQGEHSVNSDDEIYAYHFFDLESSVKLSVLDMYNNTKPEAYMDNQSAIYGSSWMYIEDCPYTSTQLSMQLANGNDCIEAYVFSDTYRMCIEARFESADKETAEKTVREIAETAYYFGDKHLTEESQMYKNKFFSIEYKPKFYLAENQTQRDKEIYFYDAFSEDSVDTRIESGYRYDSDMKNCEKCVFMSYSQAETVMKSTLDLSVCVFSHDYYEHCGVAVADEYNSMNKFDMYTELEMSESYFGSYPSYENKCIYNGDQKFTCVYFDKGDYMYKIEYSYPLDDMQAEKDMHELLEGINIK